MLSVSKKNHIPPLAWIARIEGNVARATCGGAVQTSSTRLFEGAWAGRQPDEAPNDASEVFGSGMVFTNGCWMVVPPSHLLECVYVLKNRGWWASNSLAYLVAETGLRFEATDEKLLAQFAVGAAALGPAPVVVSTSEGPLFLLYHHNAELRENLRIAPKARAPRFDTFEAYRGYLLSTLRAVREQTKRDFMATVSSGYDSVACASLVSSLGASKALTFRSARGGAGDSGAAAARALGMDVVEFDRPTNADPRTVNIFKCSGLGGEDALYAAAAAHLERHVVVTGFHGDKVWDLHGRANERLARGDLSGASLAEFRIRHDFIHVPVPFIGALHHADVRRISRSHVMTAYSIGGSYDRPTPRRMAEDAGVPRRLFGHAKKAVSLKRDADWRGVAKIARLRFRTGLLIWRLVHGSARRMWLPLHAAASNVAEDVFLLLFKQPFAVFEHANPGAVKAFSDALNNVVAMYKGPGSEARTVVSTATEPAQSFQAAQAYNQFEMQRSVTPELRSWAIAVRAIRARRSHP